jgi:hypothetical protein
MFKHTLKRMVLTGATVMVISSMAAPAAMAAPINKGYDPWPAPNACWPIWYPACEFKLY